MPEARIAAAFIAACGDELAALKPGNVHRYANGHGMCVADFEASAAAAAPALARRGTAVGQRIFDAVAATRDAVGCNTNLGILLLCAPLARAAEALLARGEPLSPARLASQLAEVLDQLDVADAELTFRAIALASPGGLGDAAEADVHGPAEITLRAAMALAAPRDRIALQYVNGYADIFEVGLPCLEQSLALGASLPWATSGLFLQLLARFPDTHLLRKFGNSVAHSVTREAQHFNSIFMAKKFSGGLFEKLLEWDKSLKIQGLNPGTTADLSVASLFVRRLVEN